MECKRTVCCLGHMKPFVYQVDGKVYLLGDNSWRKCTDEEAKLYSDYERILEEMSLGDDYKYKDHDKADELYEVVHKIRHLSESKEECDLSFEKITNEQEKSIVKQMEQMSKVLDICDRYYAKNMNLELIR